MGGQPGWMPSPSDGAGRAVAFGRRMQPQRAAPCAGVTHFVIHARHCLLKDPKVNTSQNRSIPPLCAPRRSTVVPTVPNKRTSSSRRPAAARLRGLRGPTGRSTDGRRPPLRGNARSHACALARAHARQGGACGSRRMYDWVQKLTCDVRRRQRSAAARARCAPAAPADRHCRPLVPSLVSASGDRPPAAPRACGAADGLPSGLAASPEPCHPLPRGAACCSRGHPALPGQTGRRRG
jgi:hypothetical protein